MVPVLIGILDLVDKHSGSRHADSADDTGGQFCWDCHDPHGDLDSYGASQDPLWFMIQREPVMASVTSGNMIGTPDTGATQTFAASNLELLCLYL